MAIENLVGMTLTHKTLGELEITGIDVDYSDISIAKVSARLSDRVAKFQIISLLDFFIDIPEDIKADILDIIQHKKELQQKISASKQSNITEYYNKNEFGDVLTVEDWENSKQFITEFWWSSQNIPTPAVCDGKKVYISAKAVCVDMGINTSFYSDIYMQYVME